MLSAAQIFRQTVQAGRLADLAANAPAKGAKTVEHGQAMGFNLQVMANPGAKLADAMEELSMMFEEKAMKTVGERKLGETRARSALHLRSIQSWQKILPDLPQIGAQVAVMAKIRKFFELKKKVEPDELLRMLEEESEEPAHQFAMLDAMRQGCGENERSFKELIESAREKLTKSKGGEIRSALNLAESINAQAKDAGEIKDLRALYRNEILGFKSPQHCFRSLVATRGAGRLGDALDFLVKSCGIDLESATPSQSPEELRRIILDLQSVQVLKTVMGKFETLNARMASYYGEKGLMTGEQLTGRLMDLTERTFVAADDVSSLVSSCAFAKLPSKVFFTTELLDISRTLSPRLFGENGDRFQLVDACQAHLDSLVDALAPEDQAAYDRARADMEGVSR